MINRNLLDRKLLAEPINDLENILIILIKSGRIVFNIKIEKSMIGSSIEK